MKKWNKMIGGILLVSGTTIGAGMLALPVSTGIAGFLPATLLLIFCWAFMTFTALLMLEVNLWMPEGTNLISMARLTLGKPGEVISWGIYLFLLYALTTAYIAGSGPIVIHAISALFGYSLPNYIGSVPLLLMFGFFVYKGTASVDYANRILMAGLIIAYFLIIILLSPYVDFALLSHISWPPLLAATSVVVTSFGFHIIIPTLTTYLKRDVKQLRAVIIIGGIIPLIVYLVWEFLALGIIPQEGVNGLIRGYIEGANGASLISQTLSHAKIALISQVFAFFAIITSFLGVSLSLSDCLADGFKIKKTRSGRWLLFAMTFLPPIGFAVIDPRAFLTALEYAGAFGVITLLGLMPALMVWKGRYILNYPSSYTAPGGKMALIFVIVISLGIICSQII